MFHNFLERSADQAFRGECAAQTRLSEAQSELDRREWKMQGADRALHESGIQLHSQRMELYQVNLSYEQSQREKDWLLHRIGNERHSSSRRLYEKFSRN